MTRELQHFRQLLLKRRDVLCSLAQTGRDAAGTVELDQSKVRRLSRMDALQTRPFSKSMSGGGKMRYGVSMRRCSG